MKKTNKSDYWKDVYKKSHENYDKSLEDEWEQIEEESDERRKKQIILNRIEHEKNNPYTFKFFYKDGTTDSDGTRVDKPEKLYIDFDGLLEWDDYYDLYEANLTTSEILKMAIDLYDYLDKEYYRIEIINAKTNEVIDYIEK